MAFFVKRVIQGGVILVLVGGVATAAMVGVAGKDRTRAFFQQTRHSINDRIDQHITDPVALRTQLRDLEAQYPKRIGEVRGSLAELREQAGQLKREFTVSTRVVELADQDHDRLASALDQAAAARVQAASFGGVDHDIVIVFKEERIPVEAARSRLEQISATRNAYSARAADIQKHLGYLQQQESRLVGLLNKLESERANFQTQLWDLDRQIDAIARNERMIDVLNRRQATIDQQSRYRAASLDQLNGRLAELRATQESKLETLAGDWTRTNYEEMAKHDLDRELLTGQARQAPKAAPQPARRVIEIHPEDAPARPNDNTAQVGGAGPVASGR